MKTSLTPIIAADFIDATGERCTDVQFCETRARSDGSPGLVAVVIVKLGNGGTVAGSAFTATHKPRAAAWHRLARRYQTRSIPQRFAARPS